MGPRRHREAMLRIDAGVTVWRGWRALVAGQRFWHTLIPAPTSLPYTARIPVPYEGGVA
jgi:hypothetical protein